VPDQNAEITLASAILGSLWHFLRETPDVVLGGFIELLPAALQVLGVAVPYIRALEVAGEDHLEILLAVVDVAWQMIQPGPSRVD
jgi:hypothetical protein